MALLTRPVLYRLNMTLTAPHRRTRGSCRRARRARARRHLEGSGEGLGLGVELRHRSSHSRRSSARRGPRPRRGL
eukprot:scaffold32488_cov78-Phaeocystis_antarctica.AAC.1